MSRAVANFDYDIDAVVNYLLPIVEVSDDENLFNYDSEEWYNLTALLLEGLKLYSEEERKFDFKLMFRDLRGKIPYKGKRVNVEYDGGKMVMILFCDAVNDYLLNLKMDPARKKIIAKTARNFKKYAIKGLKQYVK
ncbi:MAG: hypothetical protein SVK54_08890 [candidate division WOR-3 bacterium]|nr:hypothetical protein [candidate division WOR-3 bacterium]